MATKFYCFTCHRLKRGDPSVRCPCGEWITLGLDAGVDVRDYVAELELERELDGEKKTARG